MTKIPHILLATIAIGFAFSPLFAQTSSPTPVDDMDVQSWNDLSISKKLNDKVDAVVQTTFRFTKNIGRFNEGRIGGGFVFKPNKSFAIAPTYLFIRVRNSSGHFATENRLSLGVTYRFPVKKIGLSHRSQAEYRIRSSRNSWRYRPSVTVEVTLPETFAKGTKLYLTEEPFYDSIAERFSRNRLTFGVNKTLTDHLSVDLYYMRQDDRNSPTRVTHVIGTGWKLKF